MKIGFYPKIAWDGIRKNRRLYVPYFLTGSVMVMMSYLIFFLSSSEYLKHMEGGGSLRSLLPFGSAVIALFSLAFMFYSRSFLMRRRYGEFGLYSVLGMGKSHLRRVMLYESLMTGGISVACGLAAGIAFSKLAELCMHNLLREAVDYTLRIDVSSIGKTVLLFAGIYFLLFLSSVWKVQRSHPLEMMHTEHKGEKAPKGNWILAVLGMLILGVAYYLALSIKSPLSAVIWFFVAVILVMIATYLLFVAGSVFLCKLLQKNKRYYYQTNHFVSVSSMAYRMKRNGAGLASICILITMVLVMISSTLSLYIGAEDSLAEQYPKEISMRMYLPSEKDFTEETFSKLRDGVNRLVPNCSEAVEFSSCDLPGCFTDSGFLIDLDAHSDFNVYRYENVGYLYLISLSDYNRLMNTQEALEDGECLIYGYRTEWSGDIFSIQDTQSFRVKRILEEMYIPSFAAVQIVPSAFLIVNDVSEAVAPFNNRENSWGYSVMEWFWSYDFNLDASSEEILEAYHNLHQGMGDLAVRSESGGYSYSLACKEAERSWFFGMYAGLLFIGIFLSVVFLFATVLMMYYKQISEGYEDAKRFDMMKKVGMTEKDIRRSIHSQMLTVFLSPLLLAGLHLAFAFPLIWKLLQLFNFSNLFLMIGVTLACFVVFGVVYLLVYAITSNVYYSLVSKSSAKTK